jgi:hypothetical protein
MRRQRREQQADGQFNAKQTVIAATPHVPLQLMVHSKSSYLLN